MQHVALFTTETYTVPAPFSVTSSFPVLSVVRINAGLAPDATGVVYTLTFVLA